MCPCLAVLLSYSAPSLTIYCAGKFIGAEQLLADASPLLLKMKHMTFSPVDADLRMSGPLYAGEGPGAWEVWLTEGKGRWAVDERVEGIRAACCGRRRRRGGDRRQDADQPHR